MNVACATLRHCLRRCREPCRNRKTGRRLWRPVCVRYAQAGDYGGRWCTLESQSVVVAVVVNRHEIPLFFHLSLMHYFARVDNRLSGLMFYCIETRKGARGAVWNLWLFLKTNGLLIFGFSEILRVTAWFQVSGFRFQGFEFTNIPWDGLANLVPNPPEADPEPKSKWI